MTTVKKRKDTSRRFEKAHRSAVEYTIQDIVKYLQAQLGQNLVARIAGVTDPKSVTRWTRGSNEPAPERQERLRAAFQVFVLLNQEENDYTVRAWFIGMNPQLGDRAPAIAISEGDYQDVMAAARAYLAGG